MTARVPAIVVHGGAGAPPTDGLEGIRAGMLAAIEAGWARLASGGTSLDAVEAAVRVLEDDPRFNAGRGAVLTTAGTVELDASIMEGDRLRCGAVAAVSGIANPVSLARRVLEDGRHVLLVADGARLFARAHGISECDPESLVTERQRQRWLAHWGSAGAMSGPPQTKMDNPSGARDVSHGAGAMSGPAPTKMDNPSGARDVSHGAGTGTVGAVALDANGTIAAATSTGGTPGQLLGRVGDSALIGCGTYADSTGGGVSCTGSGEAIIRTVLAHRALGFLRDARDAGDAAQAAVDLLVDEGRGVGGLILLDWHGRIGFATSTPFMPVAWRSPAPPGPMLAF